MQTVSDGARMPVRKSGLWILCLKPLGFTVSHLVEELCLWEGVDGGEVGNSRKKELRIQQDVPCFIHTTVNFPQNDYGTFRKQGVCVRG